MSKVDFLVPPTAFQPSDVMGRSHHAEIRETLAYHGLLDPAQWLEPLVYKGAFKNKTTTFFHNTAPKIEEHGWGKPSVEDIERARAGEEWKEGPSSVERLLLWTLSQQTPTPLMGGTLAELAMEHRWRFALNHLANTPGLLVDKAFGFNALFEKSLTQQHWVGAVQILAEAYVDSPETTVGSVVELAEQWKTKTLTHTAFQGFMAALPEGERRNPALWQQWLEQWTQKLKAKDFQAEQLMEGLLKAFETDGRPEAQELVSKAHLALSVNAPAERVADHAHAYSAYWATRHPGQLPPFSDALLASYSVEEPNMVLLELGRRAACFSAMLDRYNLGTPEARAQEHLQLYWIERSAFEKVAQQRNKNPQPRWKQDLRENQMFEKRKERLERQRQRQQWTVKQLTEGLVAFYNRTPKELPQAFPNQGWAWLVGEMSADPNAWQSIHQSQGDQPSLVQQILRSGRNYVLHPWLKVYRDHVEQGMAQDPAIPNALLWLLQKLGSSNESRTRNREAWEAGNAPETWAQDKVGAHLAGTLSFLAHRGMLDLRLETLDPVGGLDGIIVPLRELRLEQSLAATANRPRPRM